ncbi:MAG: phosphotransferase [Dermatophilaceae bacterium]
MGKSRLLGELTRRLENRFLCATLDLHLPRNRQPEYALAALRHQFGDQGVCFDRFDFAYAVLWQRLNQYRCLTPEALPFLSASPLLRVLFSNSSESLLVGTTSNLVSILRRSPVDETRVTALAKDDAIANLEDLVPNEIADTLTYILADDLRRHGQHPYLLAVDSYESLKVAGPEVDAWLRNLVGALFDALTIIASRDSLIWPTTDPSWTDQIRIVQLSPLDEDACRQFLAQSGVHDAQPEIISITEGLPYYLNLAVDALCNGATLTSADSQVEIVRSFLAHVPPDQIRILEVLSPVRLFDYGIYTRLARAFGIPSSAQQWRQIERYSFIKESGRLRRMHSLMSNELRLRLGRSATRQAHETLARIWEARAKAANEDDPEFAALAWREAAFSAVLASTGGVEEVFRFADKANELAGTTGVLEIISDLEDPTLPVTDMSRSEVARCLKAECLIATGDAAEAESLLRSDPDAHSKRAIDERRDLALAHSLRIQGHTQEAIALYRSLRSWVTADRLVSASLWAADLSMAGGRFTEAARLCTEVASMPGADSHRVRGDVARLRFLSALYALDLREATRWLDEANHHFGRARDVLALGQAETNRAELLAATDPLEGVRTAEKAIASHRRHLAHHELGKAFTALGAAHIRLNQLTAANEALDAARDALRHAGYRSGEARALFYTAVLRAKEGAYDEAASHATHVVSELEKVEVYPTVIGAAVHLLRLMHRSSPRAERSLDAARERIDDPAVQQGLDERCLRLLEDLLGRDCPILLLAAALDSPDRSSGYYNINVRRGTTAGPVLVRAPIRDALEMDLRIWPEHRVLEAVQDLGVSPRVLFASENPLFQLQSVAPGVLLDDIAPRGHEVARHVVNDVATLLGRLTTVPQEALPHLPKDWPRDRDSAGFATVIAEYTQNVYRELRVSHAELYEAFGLPDNALVHCLDTSPMRPRSFGLLHCDLHRKNIFVHSCRSYFIDWELALWGDPVYDLAVHLHKMAYIPGEARRLVHQWYEIMPEAYRTGWEDDLQRYRQHEVVKSAVVDAARYCDIIRMGVDQSRETTLASRLADKLGAAFRVLGCERHLTSERVIDVAKGWPST